VRARVITFDGGTYIMIGLSPSHATVVVQTPVVPGGSDHLSTRCDQLHEELEPTLALQNG
jgi:hypothetical protein